MIPAIGISHFAARNLNPAPVSHNVNRANVTAATSAKVDTIKHDLPRATAGVPTQGPSVFAERKV